MDECFDWLNENILSIKESIVDIVELDVLDLIEDLDEQGQNRELLKKALVKQAKRVKLDTQGFSLNLLDQLLNHVPFHQDGLVKETISKEMRKYVFERDSYTCRLCFSTYRQMYCHHIFPQGSADEDNLITLCVPCHIIIHILLKNKGYPFHFDR